MTDKQIIINKMDKPKRYCEGIDCAWCNEKEPCIYKIANELEEKLLRKEQECEELKHEVELMMDGESCKIDEYKQTLTEIKEIAEEVYNDCDNCYRDVDTNSDIDCIDCTLGGKAKLAKQILQKISESEVTNAR